MDIGVKDLPFEERSQLAKVLIKHIGSQELLMVRTQKHDDLKRADGRYSKDFYGGNLDEYKAEVQRNVKTPK
jgi:hypothetical protein